MNLIIYFQNSLSMEQTIQWNAPQTRYDVFISFTGGANRVVRHKLVEPLYQVSPRFFLIFQIQIPFNSEISTHDNLAPIQM